MVKPMLGDQAVKEIFGMSGDLADDYAQRGPWENELPLLPLPGRLCSLETFCDCNLQKEWHAMLH